MSVLDKLPTADQIGAILSPILNGNGNGGGVAGAAKLLGNIKPDDLAASVATKLDGALSSVIPSGSSSSLTSGVTSGFTRALAALPSDPGALTSPVRDVVSRIAEKADSGVSAQLGTAMSSFTKLAALKPVDGGALLASVTPAIDKVKQELVSGGFGQLRGWSGALDALQPELDRVLAGAGPAAQDALVTLLAQIVAGIVKAMLPGAATEAEAAADRLRAAVSPQRFTELAAKRAAVVTALNDSTAAVRDGGGGEHAIASAETAMQELVDALAAIRDDVNSALDAEATTPEGLTAIIDRRLTSFEATEIVDVGAVHDTLAKAIGEVEAAVRELHLEKIGDALHEAFQSVHEAIAVVDLRQFQSELDEVRAELRKLTESVEATLLEAVAAAREVLRQAHEELRSVLAEVGDFDGDGTFHFKAEKDIRDFLTGVQQALDDTVRPVIDELRTTVHDVAVAAEEALQSVQNDLTEVKRQLDDAISGAVSEIEAADIPGQVEQMRADLATVLEDLGTVDFDVVVDPVVQEIDEMADSFSKIDTSGLNDILKAALAAAVKILTDIDFSQMITAVLTKKMDEVLAIPAHAIDRLQQRVKDAVERLGQLALHELLAPLYELYTPVSEAVDGLQVATIVQPLDEWHARALAEVDKVSPEALLAPIIDLHRQLTEAVASVTPAELVRPVRALLEEAATTIESIDVAGAATEVRRTIADARKQLDALAPEQVLAPLTAEFKKITDALDAFDPKELLRPVTAFFDKLTAPLAGLTDQQAKAIETAGAPLVSLPARMDPRPAFSAMATAVSDAERGVQSVDIGAIIAALRAAHTPLREAVAAATDAAAFAQRVEALDPIRRADLGSASAEFRALVERLDLQFTPPEPPAELIARYEAARPTLESLVPTWIKPPVTAASVRTAFNAANIIGVGPEIDSLYDAVKAQVRALDPAQAQQEIADSYTHVKDALTGLDPAVVLDEVANDLHEIADHLRHLDLSILTAELDGMAADLRAVVAGLDPKPVIEGLEGIKAEVRGAVEALKPSDMLAELQQPLESVKTIVHAFSPDGLAEPLQDGLGRIQIIIEQVDLTILLEPVNDKLHELRDGLDDALDRTETAFDDMISAIPL